MESQRDVDCLCLTDASDVNPPDAALVQWLACGRQEVMGELLRRHHPRVWRLAYRLTGNADAADDLAQEAFVRLYTSAGRYRPTAALFTLLHRIVVNLVIDQRRGRKPVLRLTDLKADPPAREEMESPESHERSRRVQLAVQALPERQRAAVVLHRYESLSYREIAEILETTEAAVESLVMRGYAQLRESLADLRPM
ncbi:MAG: RNA polymerase sigma factor [Phycisphaerae bacterium]